MAWKCFMAETSEDRKKIGAMRFAPHVLEGGHRDYHLNHFLSDEYKEQWMESRAPLWVNLPGGEFGIPFCVDSKASDQDAKGWTVTGEPPNITVDPSINIEGYWHGWIKNGVITADVDGRKFDY